MVCDRELNIRRDLARAHVNKCVEQYVFNIVFTRLRQCLNGALCSNPKKAALMVDAPAGDKVVPQEEQRREHSRSPTAPLFISSPKAATFAPAIPDWLKHKDQTTSLVHSAVNPPTFVVPERPAAPAFGAPPARVATRPASLSSVAVPEQETQDDVASRPNVSHRHSAASWSLAAADAPDASHRVPSHRNGAIAGKQAQGPPAQPIGDFSLEDIFAFFNEDAQYSSRNASNPPTTSQDGYGSGASTETTSSSSSELRVSGYSTPEVTGSAYPSSGAHTAWASTSSAGARLDTELFYPKADHGVPLYTQGFDFGPTSTDFGAQLAKQLAQEPGEQYLPSYQIPAAGLTDWNNPLGDADSWMF